MIPGGDKVLPSHTPSSLLSKRLPNTLHNVVSLLLHPPSPLRLVLLFCQTGKEGLIMLTSIYKKAETALIGGLVAIGEVEASTKFVAASGKASLGNRNVNHVARERGPIHLPPSCSFVKPHQLVGGDDGVGIDGLSESIVCQRNTGLGPIPLSHSRVKFEGSTNLLC